MRAPLLILLLSCFGGFSHAESMRCFKKFDRKIKALENIQFSMNGAAKSKPKNSPVQLKLISKSKKG